MAEVEVQVRRLAEAMTPAEPVRLGEVAAIVRAPGRARAGRARLRVAAFAVALVVAGAVGVVAIRAGDEARSPVVKAPVGATAPAGIEPLGSLDGAAVAVAAVPEAIVAAGDAIWRSADGRSWERASVEELGRVHDVVATAAGFVAVGVGPDEQAAVWRSPDGQAWSRVEDVDLEPPRTALEPRTVSVERVAPAEGGLVAVGSSPRASRAIVEPTVWHSHDGTIWRRLADGFPQLADAAPTSLTAVAAIGETVVVIGTSAHQSTVWTTSNATDDGAIEWSQAATIDGVVTDLVQHDDRLVAIGRVGREDDSSARATIWHAAGPDWADWEIAYQHDAETPSAMDAAATNGQTMLVAGHTGGLSPSASAFALMSSDGRTWATVPDNGGAFATGASPTAVAARGDDFIVLAAVATESGQPTTAVFATFHSDEHATTAGPDEPAPTQHMFDAVRAFLWIDGADTEYSAQVRQALMERIEATRAYAYSPSDCFQDAPLFAPSGRLEDYENLDRVRTEGYLAAQLRPPPAAVPGGRPRFEGCPREVAGAMTDLRRAWDVTGDPFLRLVQELERTDPTIIAAMGERRACYRDRGYPLVRSGTDPSLYPDSLLTDGWVQENLRTVTHELTLQLGNDYADCMQPLVDARTAVRGVARDEFIVQHEPEIRALQEALDRLAATLFPS